MFNRETHKSRGFGFIIFESEESVDRVCEQTEHSIREKAVEVKRAIPRSQMGTGGSSPVSATSTSDRPISVASNSRSPVNNPPSITSPIRPAARRAVTGNVTTLPIGNSVSGTPIKKPPTMSSYAAALLQGNDNFDLATSEIDASTTMASHSSIGSMAYNDHVNINFSNELNRPHRAYSEPIVQVKGNFSQGYLNGLYEDFASASINASESQAFKDTLSGNELRPSSLSFDYTFANPANTSMLRPSADSPPIAWSQLQNRSQVPSADAIGTINNVLGLNWLSPPSNDPSSPSSQPVNTTSSLDSSSYLSNLRAQEYNSTYSSQSSLASLGFSSSPRETTWASLVSKSQPSPISPPRSNYALSPTPPQHYSSPPSHSIGYYQGYLQNGQGPNLSMLNSRQPGGYSQGLFSHDSTTLSESRSLDSSVDYSLNNGWLSGRKL